MKIAFVLTAHLPDDERVWEQQAAALKSCGHEVFIISSKTESCELQNVVCFYDNGFKKGVLLAKIRDILLEINPQIVICDNPISVLSARKYKKTAKQKTTIIYDITEWYPSKKNLQNINILQKIIKFAVLTLLSFYVGCTVDKFIFGEYHKAQIFRILFPLKKHLFLSYFANVEAVKRYPLNDISRQCELFYSGNLNRDKGFDNVLNVAVNCAEKMPNTKFILKIISEQNFDFKQLKNINNLEIKLIKKLPFSDFCAETGKSDLFLDLRKTDFENTRCLPIKIFYYLAAGRPVIYSELKSIKKFFPKNELDNFGALVNPKDTAKTVQIIENYIENPDYYRQHCDFAYEIAKTKYNWQNIESSFVKFVCPH